MTERDLLDFTHEYRKVRGFSPHRVHLTRSEWIDLVSTLHQIPLSGEATFDGARIIRPLRHETVAAIRAWDLLPYGSEP